MILVTFVVWHGCCRLGVDFDEFARISLIPVVILAILIVTLLLTWFLNVSPRLW